MPVPHTTLVIMLFMLAGPLKAVALENQLADHPSPYVALHGSDPVMWQDWNEAAVRLAREQNKPLYISIGYFSCHWCHVMQRESYKNPKIAQVLNEHFIPVKVDRELESALDARMIEFAERTRGRAGWPLNVFLTPEGHPMYAVLYLPAANFETVLVRLAELWEQDPVGLAQVARQEARSGSGPGAPHLSREVVEDFAQRFVQAALALVDDIHGGFGTQNKFPSVPQLSLLLDQYVRVPSDELRDLLVLTLDQMATNGLYDHLGGGFFRYTVDPSWETPHFEKMLYDNAQLARLYLRAGKIFKRDDYLIVATETLDFMIREMTDSSGALYASFSSVDDKDIEGGYYLWHDEDLKAVLTDDEYSVAKHAWRMTDAPPFDAGYLPMRGVAIPMIAQQLGWQPDKVVGALDRTRRKLRGSREQRRLPVDSKLLAGWNGLALASFAEAAAALDSKTYRAAANKVRDYLVQNLWDGQALRRAVTSDRAIGQVALEDYAYVAAGLWAWARLTGDDHDYRLVADVVEQTWRRFYRKGWLLAERTLIAQPDARDVLMDGPMPAPSGVVASVSLQLARRTTDNKLRERVLAALNSGHEQIRLSPFWFASHVDAMMSASQIQ